MSQLIPNITEGNKHVPIVKVLFPPYRPSSGVIDVDYGTIIAVSSYTWVNLSSDAADLPRNRSFVIPLV